MTEPVSDALLKLLGECDGFEVERVDTEAQGDDVFGAPAPRLVLENARGAIRIPALRERDPHMGHQQVVDHCPPALGSILVAEHGRRQHAAHESRRELVLVTSDHGASTRLFREVHRHFLRRPAPAAVWPPRGGGADSLAPASRLAAPTPPHSPPAGLAFTPAADPVGPLIPGRSASAPRRPSAAPPPSATPPP